MKHDNASSAWKRLESPKAARVVTDPGTRRFFEPFLGQERTVGEVASELGVHMSSVLYRVKQFLSLGLLEVARVEPRAGRPLRYYRTAANVFFVPFQAMPLTGQEELSGHVFSEWQRLLNESIGRAWAEAAGEQRTLGVHIRRDATGIVYRNIIPDFAGDTSFFDGLLEPEAPAVWDQWAELRLSQEDAKALQKKMARLLGSYYGKKLKQGGREYIVRSAMAPLKPSD